MFHKRIIHAAHISYDTRYRQVFGIQATSYFLRCRQSAKSACHIVARPLRPASRNKYQIYFSVSFSKHRTLARFLQ